MMHSVPSTFSPSSFRITRSTPCVEGCCGPMLRTNSVESRKVWSGIPASLAAFDIQVFLHPSVVLLKNSVVLAQRIALPLLRQQNPFHIGMSRKLDAEHVEDFALQPIGGEVDIYRRLRLVSIGDIGLHAHALVASEAIHDVNQVESLGTLGPIDGRNVH